MEERIITEAMLLRYRAYLEEEEKSRNNKKKYMRDLSQMEKIDLKKEKNRS